MKIKQFVVSTLGIDKVVGYTISARLITAVGSILTLSLIALFLTKDEQGFYYTFGSILAIQVFFELGFNGIISQFAAHESAHISSYNCTEESLEHKAQSRLSSLLHFCIRWFSIGSIAIFFILLVVGFFFFSKYGSGDNVNWKIPWLILVINTSLSFMISPLLSFLEGIGRIKDVSKIRLYRQLFNLIILWSLLALGGGLLSAPIAGVCSFILTILLLLFTDFRPILIKIYGLIGEWKISYKYEIFPYQWKIAISWISGYFIFQLFNPILFATEGAVVAGQMGMTRAALNGVSGLTFSWITTKVPTFSELFATKRFKIADLLFAKTLKQVLAINFSGVTTILLIVFTLKYFNYSLADRFLPLYLVAILGLSIFLNQLVFSWATYLRCHKKEPYLITSVVGSILVAISTILLGYQYGAKGMIIGYVTIVVLMKIWEYKIFIHYRNKWHSTVT